MVLSSLAARTTSTARQLGRSAVLSDQQSARAAKARHRSMRRRGSSAPTRAVSSARRTGWRLSNVGRDPSPGTGHGSNDDPGQNRNGLAAGEDQDGPPLVRGFSPPHLALSGLGHQVSSAIICRVASSGQPTSCAACGRSGADIIRQALLARLLDELTVIIDPSCSAVGSGCSTASRSPWSWNTSACGSRPPRPSSTTA